MTDMTIAERDRLYAIIKDALDGDSASVASDLPVLPASLEDLVFSARDPAALNSAARDPAAVFQTPIKCVLFDIYGTLLSSLSGDICDPWAWQRGSLDALARELASNTTGEELKAWFADTVRSQHLAGFARTPYPEVRAEELWERFPQRREGISGRELALRFELAVNPVRPMPSLKALMSALRASGLPAGIVSNAQFYTLLILDALGLSTTEPPFLGELCLWSFREGEAKPSPVLFDRVKARLAALGVLPAETLFVGNDLLNDIFAGQEAGFATCLFAGDSASLKLREGNPVCTGVLPDVVVRDLADLAALIARPQAAPSSGR